ncbi:cell wall-binding repeat-containing protein [Clostridium saccharobutylicum]|uniref:N-acetylmuramoyl-L-alanine amidase LytC n=1 Tax=Clostridium saccharobutylicum TaxID=169679 RepID=A0A1S8N278_CLOSA|nr:cell wall-binding repeat-containing protein [Clostridium saccharobutylicum]OOM10564.1 N-acetylmuramoyl-L-alanine amidase LytC precursor [Clostridium saccharobutylicum]
MNNILENCPLTLNTTRICSINPINTAAEVSKIGFSNMKPNAVILVNKNEVFDAIAVTSLIHFPINASLLFTDGNNLNEETLKEIKRLSPKGYNGIHVILVGNISKNVSSELKEYGFGTHHIAGRNHYETACMISKVRKEFKNILIMSGEEYSEGIVTSYWSAHHGDPILFVKKDKIPQCTLEVIKKMDDINIYIVGSTKTVSRGVEDYLSNLDNVKNLGRIDGENPYEIAVNFAEYKDSKTEFGWGKNYREGHAFTFGVLNQPMDIIAGVLFAHMGKHSPSLLVGKDKTPEVVERYVKSVKPMPPKDMPIPPFMHGFILGSTQNISYNEQIMIEEMLSIDHEMMNMEHEVTDMHDEKMGMEGDMSKMMSMHHQMMNMETCNHCSDCMDMHNMNPQGKMKEMEHGMDDMNDEKMGMEDEMSKMMSMHHQMMGMDDEDAMKYQHCMHHMNKDNDEEHEMSKMEEEENMGYTHEMYMPEEDDKNYEKKPCNCKSKMSEEHRFEFNNINCRVVSIHDILK